MTKSSHRSLRQLTGRAKSRYLRALANRLGAPPERADDVDREIAGITVRGPAMRTAPLSASRLAAAQMQAQLSAPVASLPPAAAQDPVETLPPPPSRSEVSEKRNRSREKTAKAGAARAEAAATAAPTPPFNPYGFSAMAVLLNEGRAALEARLASAITLEHFMQLADAQSVRIAPEILSAKPVDLSKLRAAFIDAVQQRIAHRRAVSSA